MIEKQVLLVAAVILCLSVMATLAWETTPVLAGFTPTPIPPPAQTPQPPIKEPKATPTAINLTATPGVLPMAGAQVREPGVMAILAAGMLILATAGVLVHGWAGGEDRKR